jgi:SpoVK/Ycf46/Vps4 family AAA+-type ATPase
MDENVDFTTIVSRPEAANLTGADLSHLLTQAALDSIILGQSNIRHENFIQALTKVKASIQDNDRKAYERLREKWERN